MLGVESFMKHCVSFQPYDIWFLQDNELFSHRKLLLGLCPRCSKPVLELSQVNILTNEISIIKKSGHSAHLFAESLKPQVMYSLSECNRMKFKSVPFSWVYGINKERKLKNGETVITQYASDFFDNKVLIKRTTSS